MGYGANSERQSNVPRGKVMKYKWKSEIPLEIYSAKVGQKQAEAGSNENQ